MTPLCQPPSLISDFRFRVADSAADSVIEKFDFKKHGGGRQLVWKLIYSSAIALHPRLQHRQEFVE